MNKIFKRILIILGGILAFILVAVIITAVVTGITLHNAEVTYGNTSELALGVSPEDIAKNPKKYDGKFVRVRGVLSVALEDIALYPSGNDYINRPLPEGDEFLSNAIWLNDTGLKSTFGVNLEDLMEYRGKYVVIEGYFNPWENGHFDCYAGTIENISYISIEKGRKIYTFEREGLLHILGYWFENHFPSPLALWRLMV